MDQVEIEVIQPEPFAAGLEGQGNLSGRWLLFQSFVVTNIFSRVTMPFPKDLLHRLADLFLIAISLRAVEMSKPCFHCEFGRGFVSAAPAMSVPKPTPGFHRGRCSGAFGSREERGHFRLLWTWLATPISKHRPGLDKRSQSGSSR